MKDFKQGDSIKFNAINSKVAKVEEQIIERVHNDNEILLKKPGVKDFSTNEKYSYSILPKVD